MACSTSCSQAACPGPFVFRPNASERKKFCMSMMTRADLEGSMVMGCVDVWILYVGPETGEV
jgi:hypothetical protein